MMTGSFFEMGSWGKFRGVTWSVLKATPMLRSWGGGKDRAETGRLRRGKR